MKVEILGASDFIGSRTAELFCLEKVGEVRSIIHDSSSLAHLAQLDLKLYTADTLNQSTLYTAFINLDIVIHAIIGSLWFVCKTVASTCQAVQKAGIQQFYQFNLFLQQENLFVRKMTLE